MSRRRFEHLFVEISLAVDARIPRYRLWLHLREQGLDPEALSREAALDYCRGPLQRFLAAQGFWLLERERRHLLRSVARFAAEIPTPEEYFSRWSS
jgi:hypothetical protein